MAAAVDRHVRGPRPAARRGRVRRSPAGYLVAVVVGLAAVSRLSFPIVPTFHPGDVAAAPARRVAARRRDDPRARELSARRARARGSQGLVRRRDLRARLPLHGGGDPDRGLHHRGVFPLLVRDEAEHERRALADRAGRRSPARRLGRRRRRARSCSRPISCGCSAARPTRRRSCRCGSSSLSLPFTFVGMLLSWTLIARGLQHRLIPLAAAGSTSTSPSTSRSCRRTRTRRRPASRSRPRPSARSSLVVLRPALARRQPLARLGRRGSSLSGAVALAAGLFCVAVRGEIVGTVVAVAVFAGLVLALRPRHAGRARRARRAGALRPPQGRVSRRRTSQASSHDGPIERRRGRTRATPSPTGGPAPSPGSPSTASRFARSSVFACPRTP